MTPSDSGKALQKLFCRVVSIIFPTSHRGKTCQRSPHPNKSAWISSRK
nr:MAG TPA: hypothetical protein [Caudoviricetes sp.]